MLIGELLGKDNLYSGPLMGVEYEIEGTNLPTRVVGFRVVAEGSLRAVDGEPGREYVTYKPSELRDIIRDLEVLNTKMEQVGANPVFSNRTSVHVHINTMDMTVEQWFNMLFLWVLYEDALISYCGQGRKGNLFCLSSREAEGMMLILERYVSRGDIYVLDDEVRYCAANIAATVKYGTIEFRSMRGTTNPNILIPWFKILNQLRITAMEFKHPADMIQHILNNYEDFTNTVFGDYNFIIGYPDMKEIVIENCYRCFLIIDKGNWDKFNFIDEPAFDI